MKTRCFISALLFCVSLPVLRADDLPGVVSSEFIFETAPFASCHASTIVETKRGMTAAWFGGTKEGAPDVGIWLSHQEGGKWAAPIEVANGVRADGKRFACFNPVLFHLPDGSLALYYKAWSEAEKLPEPLIGPVKNKPVTLSDGSLLSGSSTEDQGWRVHFEHSTDGGKTWQFIGPVNDGKTINAIQPSILFLGGDKLMAIGRTKEKHLFEIHSDDNGKTWGTMTLTDLPNPNSGTDAVTLRDGRHLLIYNHTAKGRSPLNLAVSKDGKNWEAALVLESEPGEYSYPAIIQTGDGLVHIVHTWKRLRIRHWVIDPTKLKTRPIVGGEWPK
jgi:alpha-L-rhamnosidase